MVAVGQDIVEAIQRVGRHTRLGRLRDQVAQRRGTSIGTLAAARELVLGGLCRCKRFECGL